MRTSPVQLLVALALLATGAASQVLVGPSWKHYPLNSAGEYGHDVASAGDIDGDGYEDVIVAGRTGSLATRAAVYLGSATGLGSTPDWEYLAPDEVTAVAGVGDLNDDGYDDVAVGMALYDSTTDVDTGRVEVFFGSATGLAATPDWGWNSIFSDNRTGASLAGVGDVNSDGFDDMLVGAPHWNFPGTHNGAAHLFIGGPILSNGPKKTLTGPETDRLLGTVVAGLGDVNGDGIDDLAISGPGPATGATFQGEVWVFHGLGSFDAIADVPDRIITGFNLDSGFGSAVAAADANGDGFADLLIGAPDNGTSGGAHLWLGSASGFPLVPAAFVIVSGPDGRFGAALGAAGDVDGDGFEDFLVGAPEYAGGYGRAYLVQGGAEGIGESLFAPATAEFPFNRLGASVASADVDADGEREQLLGVPSPGQFGGVEIWHYDGIWTTVGEGLVGVSGVPELFGTGSMLGGDFGQLTLTNAAPSSVAAVLVSIASFPVPFKGGTLTAFPILVQISHATTPWGEAGLLFVWPDGLVSGLELYFQFIVQDAAAVKGIAISNAVRAAVP